MKSLIITILIVNFVIIPIVCFAIILSFHFAIIISFHFVFIISFSFDILNFVKLMPFIVNFVLLVLISLVSKY